MLITSLECWGFLILLFVTNIVKLSPSLNQQQTTVTSFATNALQCHDEAEILSENGFSNIESASFE